MRPYRMSLNRVRDCVKLVEGKETLTLYVDADAMRIVPLIADARERILMAIQDTGEEREAKEKEAALYFASVLFGDDQALKLNEFYHGDISCIANVCSKYFTERLCRLITKAQKKNHVQTA